MTALVHFLGDLIDRWRYRRDWKRIDEDLRLHVGALRTSDIDRIRGEHRWR